MGFFHSARKAAQRNKKPLRWRIAAVTRFLEQRQENFKVYVVLFDHQPIVLIRRSRKTTALFQYHRAADPQICTRTDWH